MATTEVSICNGALLMIGGDTIMDLTDNSEEARACAERFAHVRDSILQIHPWPFCIFRASLNASTDKPLYDYQYKFLLPTSPSCLMLLEVFEDDDWVVEDKYLVCNSAVVNIKYIGRVTDASRYPSVVADLMSARLAYEIAYKLVGSAQVVALAQQAYQLRLAEALSRESKVDNMPQMNDDVYTDKWARSRMF